MSDQAPPSMGFSRQEYWSGLPFPSPGDLPNPGIEPGSPTLQADALTSEAPGKPRNLLTPFVIISLDELVQGEGCTFNTLDCKRSSLQRVLLD